MSVQAYKDSEVGRIPLDWSVKQIGKIGYTYSGLTGKGKNDFGKGNSRYITFLNVLNNPVLRTDIFERVSISDGEHQNLALKGDLFFNTSSETPEEVGICALLDNDVPNLYLNSFCFGYRLTDPEVDGLFLSYFFRSKAGRDIMTMLAQGATRYNLSKESFNKTLIAFPPFEEQKKITEALSGVDAMIRALDEAIAKKRQIKEGLMQQLLTGKTRLPGFCGEWKEFIFDQVFTTISDKGKNIDSSEYKVSGLFPIIDQGQSAVAGYTNRDNPIVPPIQGCIVFGDHTRVFKFVDFPFFTGADGTQLLAIKPAFSALFVYFQCCRLDIPNTGYNRHFKYLKEKSLMIPETLEEQSAIARVLSSADAEIVHLEVKRDKFTLIKKGMMQELLTGIKRF